MSKIGSIQVDKIHYNPLTYDVKGRFASYWHQMDEVIKTSPSSILEVGVGNKFYHTYIKNNFRNIIIKSVDIDSNLDPDYCASVTNLPLENAVFDCVVCFQTLEHLPFDNFKIALSELSRVSKKWVILSLPDRSKCLSISFNYYPIINWQKVINIPQFFPKIHNFDGQHYWEIGKKEYPLKRITKIFNEVQLNLIKTYRVMEKPIHRFFILEKTQ